MEKVAYRVSLESSKNGWIGQNQKFFRWFLLLGVILLAAFVRLYRIQDYMTFLGDEGRDALIVKDIIEGIGSLLAGDFDSASKKLTLLGPTASVGGFFLGPIYYYFMAPFLWLFNYNPVGPAVMVALFGIATVWLVYKVGSEFFGPKIGFISAVLYSISPLVIAYSRSSWNPNLMPFFSLLSLYILYKAISKNKASLFVLCGVLLGIAMQLHYLAIFLGVIAAVYMLIARIFPAFYSSSDPPVGGESRSRSSRQAPNRNGSGQARTINFEMVYKIVKDYLYIFFGFFIGWFPFLLFEIRHGFPNLQSIINFIFQSEATGASSRFFETVYNVFFRLFGRLVANFPPPEQVALGAHPNIALWYYATLTLGIASVSIFLLMFYKKLKERNSEINRYIIILIWFFLGIGLFGFYKKPIYDYYFGFMFPLPFWVVGLTIVNLYTNTHEYARYIVGSLSKSLLNRAHHEFTRNHPLSPSLSLRERVRVRVAVINLIGKVLSIIVFVILVWINVQGIPFRYPPNRQLAQVEEISRFVIEKTDGKQFNFALITGGNSDHAYRYFFTIWNREPITIESPQKDPTRKTVTEQLLVVCETNPCGVLGHSLWEIAGFGRAEIVGEWNVSVVKVYRLVHHQDVNTSDGGSPERAEGHDSS